MSDLMLPGAEEMSDEEAGGHGERWTVFNEDTAQFVSDHLSTAVQEALVPEIGIQDPQAMVELMRRGEPDGALLLYGGEHKTRTGAGLMILIEKKEKASNELSSFYPFLGAGFEASAQVDKIALYPNRLEAVLDIDLADWGLVSVFDPLFAQHRSVYRQGRTYRFTISALAYDIQPARSKDVVIDDPEKIRIFRSHSAWLREHGEFIPERDAAARDAWQPSKPEDFEPVRFDMSQMAALLPSSIPGDAEFRGEIVRITPNALPLPGRTFWRLDVIVMRDEEDFVLPIFVADKVFEGGWRPEVGEYVEGVAWMQAYPVGSE